MDFIVERVIPFYTALLLFISTGIQILILWLLYYSARRHLDPEITMNMDASDSGLMLLVVENTGDGDAKNISFDFGEQQILRGIHGRKLSILTDGLPRLSSGRKRTMILGATFQIMKDFSDDTVEVTIKYESERKLLVDYKKHTRVCSLETKSYRGCSRNNIGEKQPTFSERGEKNG